MLGRTPRIKDSATGFSQTTPIEGTQRLLRGPAARVQYIGKLTYSFNPDHSLALSVYGTPRQLRRQRARFAFSSDGGPEVERTACTGVQGSYERHRHPAQRRAPGHLAQAVLLLPGQALLLDATLGWHHQNDSTLPSDGSGSPARRVCPAQSNIAWRRTASPARALHQ